MTRARLPGSRRLTQRIDTAIRWRVDEAVAHLARRLEEVEARADWTANEMVRLAPHVAALDERLEDLRTRLEDEALVAAADDLAPARTVLDEIRREHALVRERLGAMGVLEERLRVVEESGRQDA